ncbi:uncharacterized protein LOC111370002 [Olea europaea var. sylvestris]|uniref:uncharacterized protein LOC111370002 n=1 Tax=Olea europaea var. sylvestris TaxID=158386 RepID=UPI000C1D8539|nr:uncharacterized protein LOC111370002 [Olea europaea var. sylvestris]
MMFICEKGKDDFITGVSTPLATTDPKFKLWKLENNMVMSWLINSMTKEIGENFLLYNTAKEIWDAAKEIYSSNENISESFEIETVLHDLQQEHRWECPVDAKKYKEITEKKRIFKFLMGLNKDVDEVRGRIRIETIAQHLGDIFKTIL